MINFIIYDNKYPLKSSLFVCVPQSLPYIDYDIIKSVINYNVVVIASSDALKLHQTIYSYHNYGTSMMLQIYIQTTHIDF